MEIFKLNGHKGRQPLVAGAGKLFGFYLTKRKKRRSQNGLSPTHPLRPLFTSNALSFISYLYVLGGPA
jgi:hypothetical protein